jgi:hypothetical protein
MALLDDIRSHLAVANEDQRKRRGAVLLREAAAEIERLRAITPSESDSPQAIDSEPEIDALEYVVHQGIIGAYDRPVLLAWLARLQRTPGEPSTPGEGTRQTGCTLTDAEREAIAWAAGLSETRPQGCRTILRSLLERTRNGAPDGCETGQ